MFWFLILVFIGGFYTGSRIRPTFTSEQGVWYIHYNVSKAKRNKKRLF